MSAAKAAEGELTWIQNLERRALVGDRQAMIQVVSALRGYRQVVKETLARRYRDGFIDGAASAYLEEVVAKIEDPPTPSADEE